MSWLRWEATYDTHPDVMEAGWEAAVTFERVARMVKLHGDGGVLPVKCWSARWLSRTTGVPEDVLTRGMAACLSSTLLRPHESGGVEIPGWRRYQPDPSKTERQARWRAGVRDRDGIADVDGGRRLHPSLPSRDERDDDIRPVLSGQVDRVPSEIRVPPEGEAADPAAEPAGPPAGAPPEVKSEPPRERRRHRVGADRHSQFIAWWVEHYPAAHEGHEYTGLRLAPAKEGAAAKRLLAAYPDGHELVRVVERAWSGERPWWAEKSATLAGMAGIAAEVSAAPSRNGSGPPRALTPEELHDRRVAEMVAEASGTEVEYEVRRLRAERLQARGPDPGGGGVGVPTV